MLWTLIHILEILIWLLLAASGAYILFFALVSLLWKKPVSRLSMILTDQIMHLRKDQHYRFLVIFPAYGEDRVIMGSVGSMLAQCYPYGDFRVAVVSDHMQAATNEQLGRLHITLLQPTFEKSSKAKALQHAIAYFEGHKKEEGEFDFVVILDADNVVDADFLERLNDVCAKGYKAIQCHRCAKNSENDIAVLDGVSEEINNTIFRKAHNRIGLSSALIGSGMCFDYRWFRSNVGSLSTAGEDRELEALLLRQRIYIHYEPEIHVYDEKVTNKDNFQRQRMRWMTAQVQSLLSLLPYLPHAIFTGNVDLVDKTIQQALIPRSMLIVLTFVFAVAVTLVVPVWGLKWWVLFVFICISLYVSTPRRLRSHSLLGKIATIPTLVGKMLANLLKMDRRNTDFIHTTHEG